MGADEQIQNQISPAQFAVLVEKMTTISDAVQRMETRLNAQQETLSSLPVIKRDIQQHDEQLERAFKAIRSVSEATKSNNDAIVAGKTTNRIIGTLASGAFVLALSIGGWCVNQLEALHKADSEMAVRLTALETRNIEADRMQSQGYIRNDRKN